MFYTLPMSGLKAAVIVPAYNAEAYLTACLDSLLRQHTGPHLSLEIIVVDDGSMDRTASLARGYAGRDVKLLQTPHRGAASARNAGIGLVAPECNYILFTDADCEAAPCWAASLVEALEKAAPEVAGAKGVYATRQSSKVARFVQAEFGERYRRFESGQVRPDFADTYSAGYRRERLVEELFDARLPGAIVEDAELGWRLRKQGYSFVYAPAAVVYHRHPATIGKYFRRKFRIGRWRVTLYRRYPEHVLADSHSSSLAKLQMVLQVLACGQFMPALVLRRLKPGQSLSQVLLAGSGLAWLFLELSFWPFMARNAPSVPRRWSWLMLNLRTLALTTGATAGVGQWLFEKSRNFTFYDAQ
ncbi:MAG TPA: glycosyltransferase [Chloroflexia bacterium]|nr:glycosyltransferase [Chloroflexia bacterium]